MSFYQQFVALCRPCRFKGARLFVRATFVWPCIDADKACSLFGLRLLIYVVFERVCIAERPIVVGPFHRRRSQWSRATGEALGAPCARLLHAVSKEAAVPRVSHFRCNPASPSFFCYNASECCTRRLRAGSECATWRVRSAYGMSAACARATAGHPALASSTRIMSPPMPGEFFLPSQIIGSGKSGLGVDSSYLLGLLAMIKCSICSYQCDN